jgi:hypothetical protein
VLTDVEEAVEDVVVTVVMVAVTVVFGQTPHRAGHFSATGVPKTVPLHANCASNAGELQSASSGRPLQIVAIGVAGTAQSSPIFLINVTTLAISVYSQIPPTWFP